MEDAIKGHEVTQVEIGHLRKCLGDKGANTSLLVVSNGAGGRTFDANSEMLALLQVIGETASFMFGQCRG